MGLSSQCPGRQRGSLEGTLLALVEVLLMIYRRLEVSIRFDGV